MIVHLPTSLRSYSDERAQVECRGGSLAEVLVDLDRHFPGIRFRIVDERDRVRRHIKLFVNEDLAPDLSQRVAETDAVHIICALSGG